MIEFVRRDPDEVDLPSAGNVRPFVDLDGNLCLKDDAGNISILAVVTDSASSTYPTKIEQRQFLGGLIRGAQIYPENQLNSAGGITPYSPGFRGMPSNPQAGAYQFVLTDAGILVPNTTGGWTIPANSAVPFPVDTIIMIENNSTSPQTLAITTDTLTLAGGTSTGSRTVAANGVASIRKRSATGWLCWGNLS